MNDIKTKIARARELCEAATEGPWRGEQYDNTDRPLGHLSGPTYHGSYIDTADAIFIAESRTLLPELADALEEMAELCDRVATKRAAWEHSSEQMERERDEARARVVELEKKS